MLLESIKKSLVLVEINIENIAINKRKQPMKNTDEINAENYENII